MNGVSQLRITDDVALITFSKVPNNLKTISQIFNAFADAGINIDMVSQTAPQGQNVSFSFTVGTEDTVKVLSLANSLKDKMDGVKPMVITGTSKIQLYGEEMPEMHGVFARAIASVAGTEADLLLITTSEVDISLLVSSAHVHEVVEALERDFAVTAE
ncbi:MAG: ACT domain-containing protein [Oscillospiraceae bacterium]|nr:ACT domain-containing protein [Oscillospiraceae bacterium]